MSRQDRRRIRLKSLLKEVSQKELADRVNRVRLQRVETPKHFPPNYVSQMLNEHRSITDKMAEEFELAMGRPDGWMDQWLPDEGGWATNTRHPDWYLFDRFQEIEDDTAKKLIREQIVHASKRTAKPKRQKASQ